MGLNPALHQCSGSAYSNTRAVRHAHTHTHAKNNPFNGLCYSNPKQESEGFLFIFGICFSLLIVLMLVLSCHEIMTTKISSGHN